MEVHERSTYQQGCAGWWTKTCHCCRWPTPFEGNHNCFVVDTCIQCDRLLKEATVNILASITAITEHQTPTDFLHVPGCPSNASYKAVLLAKSEAVSLFMSNPLFPLGVCHTVLVIALGASGHVFATVFARTNEKRADVLSGTARPVHCLPCHMCNHRPSILMSSSHSLPGCSY